MKINSKGKINNIGCKIIKWKNSDYWILVDEDGFGILASEFPSVLRKAKLYWFLYLTAEESNEKYLTKMREVK